MTNKFLVSVFFTALFTNMRILKFKSQLMIALFAAVNHLNRPPRKQNFTLLRLLTSQLKWVMLFPPLSSYEKK